MPTNTRSQTESKMPHSNSILDLFSGVTSKKQLKEKIGNADLNDILFAILVTCRTSLDRFAALGSRAAELEDKIQHQSNLEDIIAVS
jgi:hypothetical protein